MLCPQAAVVVYCGCFYEPPCQLLVRLMEEYNKPHILVCYTVDKEQLDELAQDAAGLEFAQKVKNFKL